MRNRKFITLITSALVVFTLIPGISGKAATNTKVKSKMVRNESGQPMERKVIGYFQEWTYSLDRHNNYTADKLPWDKLTHINYAFAGVNAKTYKIDFSNKAAAIEMEFPGQTNNFPYKGHFNVLNSYKLKYPNVKTLISVGGGGGNVGFYTMTDTASTREIFADSCVEFIRNYGFNGIDLDFEYPTSTPLAGSSDDPNISESRRGVIYNNYVELVKVLRTKLDEASKKDNTKYILSAALSASSWVLGGMGLGEYAKYLDFANIMTYDFHGAWNGFVGHNTPLYPDARDSETEGFPMPVLNIDWAMRYFRGIFPPEKLNMGIAYYTRGWKDVQSGPSQGGLYGKAPKSDGGAIGEDNYWHDLDWTTGKEIPAGVNPLWYAKNLLKKNDYKRYFDDISKVPYIWNENKKVFLTFEDEESMKYKADYAVDKNLGGVLIWDIQGDFEKMTNGTYVMGTDLTGLICDTFKKAPSLKETQKPNMPLSKKFKIDFSGVYSHPNYTYDMILTNNTNETISKGWKLEFDMPKSAIMQAPWGVTIDKGVDKGDFIHYTITGPGWNEITPGGNYKIQGMIKLCFTGGPQNFILNGYSSEYEQGKIDGQTPNPMDEKPLQPTLVTSVFQSKDGNYDIKLNLPANHKGTEYKIYENNVVVSSGSIKDTKVSSILYNAKGKNNGVYEYKSELINKAGVNQSQIIKVVVEKDGGVVTPENNNQWIVNKRYKVGDIATYEGKEYICTKIHTSLRGWEPTKPTGLWNLK